jgi:osmotically-inducible protein OsmY
MNKKTLLPVVALTVSGILLSGCALPLIAGAAGTAGYIGFQQRPSAQIAEDTNIKASIKKALTQRYEGYFTDVGVDVFYGNVLLTGMVPTEAEAEKVAAMARSLQGVNRVYNNMFVGMTYTSSQKARDTWISTKIQSRLLGTNDAYPLNYLISVVDGHVYILGSASTVAEKTHVLHVLQTTTGVVQVHDYLGIEGVIAQGDLPDVPKQPDVLAPSRIQQTDPLPKP